MSADYSSQQQEYLSTIKANLQIRKEIKELSDQISLTFNQNNQDLSIILSLQNELSNYQSLLSAKNSSKIDCHEINYSNAGTSTNFSSMCSVLKRVPTKEFENTNFLELTEEYEKSSFFEQFFIIGVQEKEIGMEKSLKQKILFKYPENPLFSKEILKNIKKLAFPSGITPVSFKLDESISTQVNEILYHSYYRNGNSFTSCIEKKEKIGFFECEKKEKNILYCCFVIFDEIAVSSFNGSQFVIPKCYCLLTYFPCFELHFEVLYRMLAIKRTFWFKIFNDLEEVALDYSSDVITHEEFGLIESYFEYFEDCIFDKNMHISISLQTIGNIEYTFPSEFFKLSQHWFCPLLFSLISLEDFYYILCSILQEKKVVFFSQNSDFLTSCVLGFVSLLFPLKWQHPVIPFVINDLHPDIDHLSCFIIGISDKIPEYLEDYIEYNIDTNKLVLHSQSNLKLCKDVKFPYSYNLVDFIFQDYEYFCSDVCYTPTESQIEAANNIADSVKTFIQWILNQILAYFDSDNVMDFQVYREIVKTCAGEDKEFFSSILDTDMFMHGYAE